VGGRAGGRGRVISKTAWEAPALPVSRLATLRKRLLRETGASRKPRSNNHVPPGPVSRIPQSRPTAIWSNYVLKVTHAPADISGSSPFPPHLAIISSGLSPHLPQRHIIPLQIITTTCTLTRTLS
jgi:hypothetical protein